MKLVGVCMILTTSAISCLHPTSISLHSLLEVVDYDDLLGYTHACLVEQLRELGPLGNMKGLRSCKFVTCDNAQPQVYVNTNAILSENGVLVP